MTPLTHLISVAICIAISLLPFASRFCHVETSPSRTSYPLEIYPAGISLGLPELPPGYPQKRKSTFGCYKVPVCLVISNDFNHKWESDWGWWCPCPFLRFPFSGIHDLLAKGQCRIVSWHVADAAEPWGLSANLIQQVVSLHILQLSRRMKPMEIHPHFKLLKSFIHTHPLNTQSTYIRVSPRTGSPVTAVSCCLPSCPPLK